MIMSEEMKMEDNTSEDDLNFIRRPPIFIQHNSPSEDVCKGVTPTMDQSSPKWNKRFPLASSPESFMRSAINEIQNNSPSDDDCRAVTPTMDQSSPKRNKRFLLKKRSLASRFYNPRTSNFTESDVKDKQLSPTAFINPFSPNISLLSHSNIEVENGSFRGFGKLIAFDQDEDKVNEGFSREQELQVKAKRPRLSDFNIPRYKEEFIERALIGLGQHGQVMRCLNKLNGIEYAVKRGLTPIANERLAHNEIYAHGVLEHPNIVRNYSSWTENDFVYIQNEFCNGGSLEDTIKKEGPLEERQLRRILEHVAQGLRFIHSNNLAHMDIKPGNILISKGPKKLYKPMFSDVNEFGDDEDSAEETIYKIADLGHVTKLDEVINVEEGDCRYIPQELLNTCSDLSKVDIFALGLTLYEAAGGGPLPKNGDEWLSLRKGKLKPLPLISSQFTNLIKRMIHPNAELRPSAAELQKETIYSSIYKTVKDINELRVTKHKIKQIKEQRIENAHNCTKGINSQQDPKRTTLTHNNNKGERIIGKKKKSS